MQHGLQSCSWYENQARLLTSRPDLRVPPAGLEVAVIDESSITGYVWQHDRCLATLDDVVIAVVQYGMEHLEAAAEHGLCITGYEVDLHQTIHAELETLTTYATLSDLWALSCWAPYADAYRAAWRDRWIQWMTQ